MSSVLGEASNFSTTELFIVCYFSLCLFLLFCLFYSYSAYVTLQGIPDFSLRVALQTLLKEYCEVSKSPKENKVSSFLQASKGRPRRKARKYLYAVG